MVSRASRLISDLHVQNHQGTRPRYAYSVPPECHGDIEGRRCLRKRNRMPAGRCLPSQDSALLLGGMAQLYRNARIHQVFGANTDVGKTVITTALALVSASRGKQVRYIKPISTGPLLDADDE